MATRWQPPVEGLTEEQRSRFWGYVRRLPEAEGGHWMWEGPVNSSDPAILITKGAPWTYVAAQRYAFAVLFPGRPLPGRMFRRPGLCPFRLCVNPEHFACGNGDGAVASVKAARAEEDNGMPHYRTLEAFAALQFGLPVKPRPIYAKGVIPPLEQRTIDTTDGPIVIDAPVAVLGFAPNAEEAKAAPEVTAEQIVALVFAPHTLCVTFPGGGVMISTPSAKVHAPDYLSAVLGILTHSGKHKVRG